MLIPSFDCHRVEGYFLKRIMEVKMRRVSIINIRFTLILFVLPLLVIGCGDQEINSHWSKGNIKIDGSQEDWGNTINFLKDENIGMGVQNDSNNVYICLVTSNRSYIMRALRNGLTIWIDPQNENRTYGIKYPIGMSNDMMSNYHDNQNGSYQDMGSMMKKYESSMTEFELVNKDGELLSRIPVKNDYGIELKVNIARDQLVYELKIPLDHSINKGFFVNTTPGNHIRLGFEEGKFDRSQIQQQNKENGFEGGSGEGDEGRRGDGMGGRYGEGRMGRGNYGERSGQNSEGLNTWLDVQLAGNSNVIK
jgi:hypothetical protein